MPTKSVITGATIAGYRNDLTIPSLSPNPIPGRKWYTRDEALAHRTAFLEVARQNKFKVNITTVMLTITEWFADDQRRLAEDPDAYILPFRVEL